jgi:hypothetical protein
MPQGVDSPQYNYYGPPTEAAPQATQRPAVHPSPYPELSTSTLLRQVKPPPSEGWRRWLYVMSGQLINVGESPRVNRYNDLVVQVAGEPAAAGLLPGRDAVVEGRCRQNHHHRDTGRHLRLHPR